MHKLSVLAATAALVLATAPPANAVDYVIDSEADCDAFIGNFSPGTGQSLGTQCYVATGTFPSGSNAHFEGWDLRPQSGTFTNNGLIYARIYVAAATFLNNGTFEPAGSGQIFGTLTNSSTGVITIVNEGTRLTAINILNNQGTINVNNGAVLRNAGTINNTGGTITVNCGGEYVAEPGTTLTGNAVVQPCINPTISANVSAAHPASAAGWFRDPVTITYVCAPGAGQTLDANGCPAPDVVGVEGADILREAVVRQTNHGFKRATTVLDIDLTLPQVDVFGVESGTEYVQPPTPTCVASDALSGLAGTCAVKITRTSTVGRFAYSATATDKAANVRTAGGTYVVKAPTTRISYVNVSEDRGKATFKFKGGGNVTKLECALVRGKTKPKFKKCTSPASYKNLAKGKYTFQVRAVGLGGNDASPAKETFRITG